MVEQLLTESELSRLTGRAVSTLQKDRCVGAGIPFIRLGRLVRYRQSDVAVFLASLPAHSSTSAADVAKSVHQGRVSASARRGLKR
jgi:hypothetical protein